MYLSDTLNYDAIFHSSTTNLYNMERKRADWKRGKDGERLESKVKCTWKYFWNLNIFSNVLSLNYIHYVQDFILEDFMCNFYLDTTIQWLEINKKGISVLFVQLTIANVSCSADDINNTALSEQAKEKRGSKETYAFPNELLVFTDESKTKEGKINMI